MDEPAGSERPDGQAQTRNAGPQTDGLRAPARLREGCRQYREAARGESGCAHPLDRAPKEQPSKRGRISAEQRAEQKQNQSEQKESLAPEAVPKSPTGEHQSGKRESESVNGPLQI